LSTDSIIGFVLYGVQILGLQSVTVLEFWERPNPSMEIIHLQPLEG
jgi:hypothetical protein